VVNAIDNAAALQAVVFKYMSFLHDIFLEHVLIERHLQDGCNAAMKRRETGGM